MLVTATLATDHLFIETILDHLPCGMVIIDERVRVVAVNKVGRSFLGPLENKVIDRDLGAAIGCLHTASDPNRCGVTEFCKSCEVQGLASRAFATNKGQRARAFMQIAVAKKVVDLTLAVSVTPFKFRETKLAVVHIEDLTKLPNFTKSARKGTFHGIVGKNKRMQELFEIIRQVAATDAPVFIQGESGTGKELVAHAIHQESSRSHSLFVPVNCGALPETLAESELFGHIKGAFTGALHDKKGRFSIANGGTLFLDEVSELSPNLQVKFLRVLQDGSFEPVGSTRTMRVDVRVISATNSNLGKKVEEGKFRLDLYHRLCVMPVTIPPLQRRKEDIPQLVQSFLEQMSEEIWGKRLSVSDECMALLCEHKWPGNVRELQNVLRYAAARCQTETIEPVHLPADLSSIRSRPVQVRARRQKLDSLDVFETLKSLGWNKSQTAETLGVSRATLYRFLKRKKADSEKRSGSPPYSMILALLSALSGAFPFIIDALLL
ncbi:MAG: sigma 54-interacting transcriptional regulator [Desulfoferrobacter sp.]